MRQTDTRRASIPALQAAATLAAAACSSLPGKPAAPRAAPQPSTIRAVAPTGPGAPHRPSTPQRYGLRATLSNDWPETVAQIDWTGKKRCTAASTNEGNSQEPHRSGWTLLPLSDCGTHAVGPHAGRDLHSCCDATPLVARQQTRFAREGRHSRRSDRLPRHRSGDGPRDPRIPGVDRAWSGDPLSETAGPGSVRLTAGWACPAFMRTR